MSLLHDVTHHLRTKEQMKSSILFDSDDDSTTSAASCDEECSMLESEEDLKTNLWPSRIPQRFEALCSILNGKNARNTSSICRRINFETMEVVESDEGKLPPFATSFKTHFSNSQDFYRFVQASCASRNRPVPELVAMNNLDQAFDDFAELRANRNHLNVKETNEIDFNANFKTKSVAHISSSFNKCSKLSTPDSDVGRRSKNLEKDTSARLKYQRLKARKNNSELKEGKETDETPITQKKVLGNRIEEADEEGKAQSPSFIDKGTTSDFEKISKNNKSRKSKNIRCVKKKKNVISNSEVAPKTPIHSDVSKLQNKDSFILHECKNEKRRIDEVQNLKYTITAEEQIPQELDTLKRNGRSSEMQEVAKNQEIRASNQPVFSFDENSVITEKPILNDNMECNNDNIKTFQLLKSPDFSHQEKVIEIQNCMEENENVISKDKIESIEKSDTKMNESNCGTSRSTIDVKKVVLQGKENISMFKPLITSICRPTAINNSYKTQTIVPPIFAGRIGQVTPKFLLIDPRVSLGHLLQINKSKMSDICLISDPNNNPAEVPVFKELHSNMMITSDKDGQRVVNSSAITGTVSLPNDRNAGKSIMQNISNETNLTVNISDATSSAAKISFSSSSELSRLENYNFPNVSRISHIPTLTERIQAFNSKASSCAQIPKKEVIWHNCAYCRKKFKTVKGFNNHMEKVHSTSTVPKKPNVENVSEIKMEVMDEEQNNSSAKPYINQELSAPIQSQIKMEVTDEEPNTAQPYVHQESSETTTLSEIKKEVIDEEPNIVQDNPPAQPCITQESSPLQGTERLFSCEPCRKVYKNYHRLVDHINSKHAGSSGTVKCIDRPYRIAKNLEIDSSNSSSFIEKGLK